MSHNPIEQIREAELKAEALLNEAEREAARIKKDAEEQGRLETEKAQQASRASAAALLESANEWSEQSFREAAAELDEQIRALRRQASERRASAIEAILASMG